jgi:hypothetical protein
MKKNRILICFVASLVLLIGSSGASGLTSSQAASRKNAVTLAAIQTVSVKSAVPASTSTKATVGSVKDYFPIKPNTRYVYEGSGNEYASYDVFVDYSQGTKMQQRVDNGGTVVARVIEVKGGVAKLVFSRAEAYYRENFLKSKANKSEILMKEPLRAGTKWKLADGRERRIESTSTSVSTPSGNYTAVAVVTKSKADTTTDYYAKNVGLVKSVSKYGDTEVSSSLKTIEKDKPFVQSVQFYYPNVNDDRIDSVEASVSFRTNDITRIVLANAYRDALSKLSSKVFSKNTKINSLYLNRDGMVYIDLNSAFVKEMNAGSGVESMILQSVANTFGVYYGVNKVLLTIDNKLYESGHIALKKGEYLKVKLDK